MECIKNYLTKLVPRKEGKSVYSCVCVCVFMCALETDFSQLLENELSQA